MKSIWVFVGVLALSVPVLPAFAQPFGLNRGDSLQKLKSQGITLSPTDTRYSFKTGSLPNGSNLFDDYRLFISPKSGLCRITAWTPVIPDTPYGTNTQTKYELIFAALEKKYGSSKKYDFLKAGALWRESREWMMSLLKKDRYLTAFWDRQENSNLPPDLQSVRIEAVAPTATHSLIYVSYEYTNFEVCDKERDASNSGNL